jgi:beta-galactosidase
VSLGYGGDYNPEQWDETVWAQDAALMREAGVSTATVGVFSWSRLEPEEGRYDFGWLDDVLDRLHGHGVRVILATPTASPPPWFTLAYPDAMPVTRDGTRLWHGSRDTYCAAAPAYRRAAARIAGALARRYGPHPALALWHVHNEYGTACWCDHAAAAFRRWLLRRYGCLDALNEAWGTAFWSQHYSAWEQVFPPRATQYLANPSQQLDYQRFWSDELLAAYREQSAVLRRLAPRVPVTTNFMLPDWQLLDLWRWSREVDVVAVDHYLSSAGPEGHLEIAFGADRARSLGGGRPWLLMEQAAGGVHEGGLIAHRPPGRIVRDSLGYVARGADSVLFFQWRASRSGAEMYHPALVPHAGRDTRVFREACSLGAALSRIGEVAGSVVRADVAVLMDFESQWALSAPVMPSEAVRHLDLVRGDHAALWRAGVACDFVSPEGDLSRYRLVLVPGVYLLSDPAAASLRRFAEGGGHLVVSFLSGVADVSHRVRAGGYPGALRDLLGVRAEEFHPLREGEHVALRAVGTRSVDMRSVDMRSARGTVWSERLSADGAEVLARYSGGVLDGLPAVTRRAAGDGVAWYLSTRLDGDAYTRLLTGAAEAAGVRPALPGIPPGVEAVRRHGMDGRSWLFAFNHSDAAATIPAGGFDLLTGREADRRLELAPRSVAVLREHPAG